MIKSSKSSDEQRVNISPMAPQYRADQGFAIPVQSDFWLIIIASIIPETKQTKSSQFG
jgi:hypothetical protein